MPAKKNTLIEFLDINGISYETIRHEEAITAQEIAAAAHVSGHELAKTVIITVDGEMAMAVLPATFQIDLKQLKKAIGAKKVALADENAFKDRFEDCEPGAMPPFGNLYDMVVYAAETLAEDEQIAFNAGSHTLLVKMAWADYEKLVGPTIMKFSQLD